MAANSKLIAGFIGPVMAAMGVAMLVNRELFPVIIDQISHDYGLIVLSGLLSLLAGIAIVRVHNIWSGGWQVIVTVFGWLAILGGLARMWVPQMAGPIADSFTGSAALLIAGAASIALGGFLSYKAYGSET
jgi:hypothetical protein